MLVTSMVLNYLQPMVTVKLIRELMQIFQKKCLKMLTFQMLVM